MDQSKFLKGVIIILLVINIGTLAFMWLHHPMDHPRGPHGDIAEYLTHELNFTDQQKKQFEELRNAHHEEIESVLMKDRKMHDAYFDMLQSPAEDSIKISMMADSLSANRKKIELITFHHFRKVRDLCDDQQKKKFDEVINDALRMMARQPGR